MGKGWWDVDPEELVSTFGGSYVCASFGKNRSRNATVRVLTDGQTDTLTDWQTQTSFIKCYSYRTDYWDNCIRPCTFMNCTLQLLLMAGGWLYLVQWRRTHYRCTKRYITIHPLSANQCTKLPTMILHCHGHLVITQSINQSITQSMIIVLNTSWHPKQCPFIHCKWVRWTIKEAVRKFGRFATRHTHWLNSQEHSKSPPAYIVRMLYKDMPIDIYLYYIQTTYKQLTFNERDC